MVNTMINKTTIDNKIGIVGLTILDHPFLYFNILNFYHLGNQDFWI